MTKSKFIFLAMLVAASLAMALRPRLDEKVYFPSLDSMVPSAVAQWKDSGEGSILQVSTSVVSAEGEKSTDQPYDDLLSRTYRDTAGRVIMLSIAYGKNQRQEIKVHRPELCYPAQGMPVEGLTPVDFGIASISGVPVTGMRMRAALSDGSIELVSYWIRIGSVYSQSSWATRGEIIKQGLAGRTTDGVLMRVSQRVPKNADFSEAYLKQELFAKELVMAMKPQHRSILIQ
jgi:EpsI family protein